MDMSPGSVAAASGGKVVIHWSSQAAQTANVLIFMVTLCVSAGVVAIWGTTMINIIRSVISHQLIADSCAEVQCDTLEILQRMANGSAN